jgi:hypothetical protein
MGPYIINAFSDSPWLKDVDALPAQDAAAILGPNASIVDFTGYYLSGPDNRDYRGTPGDSGDPSMTFAGWDIEKAEFLPPAAADWRPWPWPAGADPFILAIHGNPSEAAFVRGDTREMVAPWAVGAWARGTEGLNIEARPLTDPLVLMTCNAAPLGQAMADETGRMTFAPSGDISLGAAPVSLTDRSAGIMARVILYRTGDRPGRFRSAYPQGPAGDRVRWAHRQRPGPAGDSWMAEQLAPPGTAPPPGLRPRQIRGAGRLLGWSFHDERDWNSRRAALSPASIDPAYVTWAPNHAYQPGTPADLDPRTGTIITQAEPWHAHPQGTLPFDVDDAIFVTGYFAGGHFLVSGENDGASYLESPLDFAARLRREHAPEAAAALAHGRVPPRYLVLLTDNDPVPVRAALQVARGLEDYDVITVSRPATLFLDDHPGAGIPQTRIALLPGRGDTRPPAWTRTSPAGISTRLTPPPPGPGRRPAGAGPRPEVLVPATAAAGLPVLAARSPAGIDFAGIDTAGQSPAGQSPAALQSLAAGGAFQVLDVSGQHDPMLAGGLRKLPFDPAGNPLYVLVDYRSGHFLLRARPDAGGAVLVRAESPPEFGRRIRAEITRAAGQPAPATGPPPGRPVVLLARHRPVPPQVAVAVARELPDAADRLYTASMPATAHARTTASTAGSTAGTAALALVRLPFQAGEPEWTLTTPAGSTTRIQTPPLPPDTATGAPGHTISDTARGKQPERIPQPEPAPERVPAVPGRRQFARAIDRLSRELFGPDEPLPLREVIIYLARAELIQHVPSPGELARVVARLTDSDAADLSPAELQATLPQLAVAAAAALGGRNGARPYGLPGAGRGQGNSEPGQDGDSSQSSRPASPEIRRDRLPAIPVTDEAADTPAPAPYHDRAETVASMEAPRFVEAWNKLPETPEHQEAQAYASDLIRGLGVSIPVYIAEAFAELPAALQAALRIAYFLITSGNGTEGFDGAEGLDYLVQRLNSMHSLGARVPAPLSRTVTHFGTELDGAQVLSHVIPVPAETIEWLRDQIADAVEAGQGPDEKFRSDLKSWLKPGLLLAEWARLRSVSGLPLNVPYRGQRYPASLRVTLTAIGPGDPEMELMPDGAPVTIQRWMFGVSEAGNTATTNDMRSANLGFQGGWPVLRTKLLNVDVAGRVTINYGQLSNQVTAARTVQPMRLVRSRDKGPQHKFRTNFGLRLGDPVSEQFAGRRPETGWTDLRPPASGLQLLRVWFPPYSSVPKALPVPDPESPETVPAPIRLLKDQFPHYAVVTFPNHDQLLADAAASFPDLASLSRESREDVREFLDEGSIRSNIPTAWGGHVASPTLYSRWGDVVGYLRFRVEIDGGTEITGPTAENTVLESHTLSGLRMATSAAVTDALGFQLPVKFSSGSHDHPPGNGGIGQSVTVQGSYQHSFSHTLGAGGSVRVSGSLRTSKPLFDVTPDVTFHLDLVRPGSAPRQPSPGSPLDGGKAYPAPMLVPSLALVNGTQGTARYLPPELDRLQHIPLSTTPLEISGTDGPFAAAEQMLREEGYLPPDRANPGLPGAMASGAASGQRLDNQRKFDQFRSSTGLRGSLGQAVEDGSPIWLQVGAKRIRLSLAVTRSYARGAAVRHERTSPDAPTLNYAGSTLPGNEQFTWTPAAVNANVTWGFDNLANEKLGSADVLKEFYWEIGSLSAQRSDVVNSSSGTGHEDYILSPVSQGSEHFSVPARYVLTADDGTRPEQSWDSEGHVRIAVPTYKTLTAPAATEPAPIEVRAFTPEDADALTRPTHGSLWDGEILRIPQGSYIDDMAGSRELTQAVIGVLNGYRYPAPAGGLPVREADESADEDAGPLMPGSWPGRSPDPRPGLPAPVTQPPASAPGSHAVARQGPVRQSAHLPSRLWRGAFGASVITPESLAYEVITTTLSPIFLKAHGHRILRDRLVIEGASTDGLVANKTFTIVLRAYVKVVEVLEQTPPLDAERWQQSTNTTSVAGVTQRAAGGGLTLEGSYGSGRIFEPSGSYVGNVTLYNSDTVSDTTAVWRVATEDTTGAYRVRGTLVYVAEITQSWQNIVKNVLVPGPSRRDTLVVEAPGRLEFLLMPNDFHAHLELLGLPGMDRLPPASRPAPAPAPDRRLPQRFVDTGGVLGFGQASEVEFLGGRSDLENKITRAVERLAPGAVRDGYHTSVAGVQARINQAATGHGPTALVNAGPGGRVAFHWVHRSLTGHRLMEVAVTAVPGGRLNNVRGRRLTESSGLDNILGRATGDESSLGQSGVVTQSTRQSRSHALTFSPLSLSKPNQGPTITGNTSSVIGRSRTSPREKRAWHRTAKHVNQYIVPYEYRVTVTSRPLTEAAVAWIMDRFGTGLIWWGRATSLIRLLPDDVWIPGEVTERRPVAHADVYLRFNDSETPHAGHATTQPVLPAIVTEDPAPAPDLAETREPAGVYLPPTGSVVIDMGVPPVLRDRLTEPPWVPARPIAVYDFNAVPHLRVALRQVDRRLSPDLAPQLTQSEEATNIVLTTWAAAGHPVPLTDAAAMHILGLDAEPGNTVTFRIYDPQIEISSRDQAIDGIKISTDGFAPLANHTSSPSLTYGVNTPLPSDSLDIVRGPSVPVLGRTSSVGGYAQQTSLRREMLRYGTPAENAAGQGLPGHVVRAVGVIEVRGPEGDVLWVVGELTFRTTETPPGATPAFPVRKAAPPDEPRPASSSSASVMSARRSELLSPVPAVRIPAGFTPSTLPSVSEEPEFAEELSDPGTAPQVAEELRAPAEQPAAAEVIGAPAEESQAAEERPSLAAEPEMAELGVVEGLGDAGAGPEVAEELSDTGAGTGARAEATGPVLRGWVSAAERDRLRQRAIAMEERAARLLPSLDQQQSESLMRAIRQVGDARVGRPVPARGPGAAAAAIAAPGRMVAATNELELAIMATAAGRLDALLDAGHRFDLARAAAVMDLADQLGPGRPQQTDAERFAWLARKIGLDHRRPRLPGMRDPDRRPAADRLAGLLWLAGEVFDGNIAPGLADLASLRRLADLLRDEADPAGRLRHRDLSRADLEDEVRRLNGQPADSTVTTQELRDLIELVGTAKKAKRLGGRPVTRADLAKLARRPPTRIPARPGRDADPALETSAADDTDTAPRGAPGPGEDSAAGQNLLLPSAAVVRGVRLAVPRHRSGVWPLRLMESIPEEAETAEEPHDPVADGADGRPAAARPVRRGPGWAAGWDRHGRQAIELEERAARLLPSLDRQQAGNLMLAIRQAGDARLGLPAAVPGPWAAPAAIAGAGAALDRMEAATYELEHAIMATAAGQLGAVLGAGHRFDLARAARVMDLADRLGDGQPHESDAERFAWLARQIGLDHRRRPRLPAVGDPDHRPAAERLAALLWLAGEVFGDSSPPGLADLADLRRLADLLRAEGDAAGRSRGWDVSRADLEDEVRRLNGRPADSTVTTQELRDLIELVRTAKEAKAKRPARRPVTRADLDKLARRPSTWIPGSSNQNAGPALETSAAENIDTAPRGGSRPGEESAGDQELPPAQPVAPVPGGLTPLPAVRIPPPGGFSPAALPPEHVVPVIDWPHVADPADALAGPPPVSVRSSPYHLPFDLPEIDWESDQLYGLEPALAPPAASLEQLTAPEVAQADGPVALRPLSMTPAGPGPQDPPRSRHEPAPAVQPPAIDWGPRRPEAARASGA